MKKYVVLSIVLLSAVNLYAFTGTGIPAVNPSWTGTMNGVNLILSGMCSIAGNGGLSVTDQINCADLNCSNTSYIKGLTIGTGGVQMGSVIYMNGQAITFTGTGGAMIDDNNSFFRFYAQPNKPIIFGTVNSARTAAGAFVRMEVPNDTTGAVVSTFTNTGNLQIPGSVRVGAWTFKGISFTAALKLITPVLYDTYLSTDDWCLYVGTGATAYGFRAFSSGNPAP